MTLQSKLLSHLFSGPQTPGVLTVLDVGPAMSDTVEFFSDYRCRLYFLDLFSEEFLLNQADLDETELRQAFVGALTIPSKTRFDICLFWDFLNYLDDRSLAMFFELLGPHFQSETRAHGFGTLNGKTPILNHQYGLQSRSSLSVRERENCSSACYPHSQTEMRRLLKHFEINRGVLLSDGRLEMLLTTRKESSSNAPVQQQSLLRQQKA